MRDRNNGTLVAAAVAVLEKQQALSPSRPFCTATSIAQGPSATTTKNVYSSDPNRIRDRKTTDSFETCTVNITTEMGSERKRRFLNVNGTHVEPRKCSPTYLLNAATKNNACLDDVPLETDSQFKSSHEHIGVKNESNKYNILNRNLDDFESAVKNFDLVAEDVEKLVAKTNSLRVGQDTSTNTEVTEECVIYRNNHTNTKESIHSSKVTEHIGGASDEFGSSTSDDDSSATETDSDSGHEHVINEGLETITEEERNTASSIQTSEGGDSSPEDDSTLKSNIGWSGSASNHDSTSDVSSSSTDHPVNLRDSSTRCNSDFQWIPREQSKTQLSSVKMEEQLSAAKPPIIRSKTPRREKTAHGSLDRRRNHHHNRQEREQKSRSIHLPKSPPRVVDDYISQQPCQNWCCCTPHNLSESLCCENFHRRHERIDPQRYGSSPMLIEQRYIDRGSHGDLYGDSNRYRHENQPFGCCSYHVAAPPCCFFNDNRNYHWTPPSYPPKPLEGDEKFRKLQGDRDNLQLQVQVLTEQIEAQTDKISDLEKSLMDKKQLLVNAEDMLQREMLSRSSLETQKLELLSAISELKLQQAALERENIELRSSHYNNNTNIESVKKPPLMPRMSPQPQMTSTPVPHASNQTINMRMSPSPSPVSQATLTVSSPRRIESTTPSPTQRDVQPPKTPPASYRRQIDLHYSSLPRQQFISNGTNISTVDSNANPASNGSKKGVVFGRGLSSLLMGRAKGHSVPNLAETEKIVIEESSTDSQQSPPLQFNKNKGIKKILGRMKRSGSGNLEDLPGIGEFQRGGVRATAAARLGWSEPQLSKRPDKPFAEWDADNICDWLTDLGLEQYIPDAKKWIKSGQQLQEASINDIEKEFGIKNLLHKKKLQLAIIDTQENGSSDPYLSRAGELDTAWVLRWLDDTGLPQHKENFLINRVDGRVLHRLTVDDLTLLHVTSLLHVASIKRGIQVLRENNYEPGCLIRRSLPEDPPKPTPKHISLWTTHRVMEWLRAVDLAEYAPNLRGAGVHGGLMVLENKFTAELLASLLSIPPGKTLLRRHLNTHFKDLLGKEIIQEKREAEGTLGYIPLTPSAKLKVAKKSQFSLKRKKSKSEADYGDLVCPLNPSQSGELNGSTISSSVGMMKMEKVKEEDVYHLVDTMGTRSLPQSLTNSPLPKRH